MIDFYGAPASSSGRTHLMLEECGVAYEYHRINTRDPAAAAEYRKINPSGKVPFLIDGEVRIPESIAINFYLAEKYAPQLWSDSVEGRAQIYAWSLWAITNLQTETMRFAYHAILFPADRRVAAEAAAGKQQTQGYLDELELAMPASGVLVGDQISVADLNVASVANLAGAFGAGTLGAKGQAWLAALKARPAWKQVAAGG